MLSKYVEKIKNTYNEQGYFDQLGKLDDKDLFIRMYMFYQYFNADDTKLDEIEETIIKNQYIDAMYESELEEDHFDFIKVLNNINQVTLGTINDTLKITDDYFV